MGEEEQIRDFDRHNAWRISPERLRRNIALGASAVVVAVSVGWGAIQLSDHLRDIERNHLPFSLVTDSLVASMVCFAFAIVVLFAGLILADVFRSRYARRRQTEAAERVEAAYEKVEDDSNLSGLIRANREQMNAYDLLARQQTSTSHRASMWAMAFGLVLIAFGIVSALLIPDPAAKISIAAVTAIGSAVGGYIARTYLVNAARASEGASYYFQQPLAMSYLLTAERLVARLPDEAGGDAYMKVLEAALAQADAVSRIARPGTEAVRSAEGKRTKKS